MDENKHQFEIFDLSAETELLELIANVEQTRAEFQLASSRFRSLPTASYFKKFVETTNNVTQAVGETVEHIIGSDEDTPELKGRMLTTLIDNDDQERVAHFNKLISGGEFEPAGLRQSDFATFVKDLLEEADEDDDPVQDIMDVYGHNVKSDIQSFIAHVNETQSAKAIRIAAKTGKVALELSKISAAAAFGAWIATRKLRDK
jgi:hypothetical protein